MHIQFTDTETFSWINLLIHKKSKTHHELHLKLKL